MNYQDFQIRVDKNNNIRASSSSGEVSGEFCWQRNQIKLTLELIDSNKTNSELLKGLGSQLYQAIFTDKINALFHATMASATANGCSVRLRLIFESPELSALPWEFLYDEDSNTFLGNNTQTVLSRYIDVPLIKRDIKTAILPLKILLAYSTPSNLPPLEVAGEKKLIREALGKRIEAGDVELDVLQEATIGNINQKLREKPYNVFHFIGHCIFEDNQGLIVLGDTVGKSKLLDDESFANLFLGNKNLGLVILNSHRGATVSVNQVFAATAINLVRRGIPAVIAMQYSILDSTAKLFVDEFYRTLALGYPVDAAIQTTRNAISIEVGLDKRDFATPVLYMRASDGIILDVKTNVSLKTPKNLPNNIISNKELIPLSDIPVIGDEASEVGADYTKLRDLLCNKKFGLADLETLNKILWITNREKYGWLLDECIRELPSCDLSTIDRLWLSASKGKYGFSVQKRIWFDLGGKLENINCDYWDQWDILKRFIEEVKWNEVEKIVLDPRAAKGHLPMGLYANLDGRKIYQSWRNRVGSIEEEERQKLEAEIEKLKQDLTQKQVGVRMNAQARIQPPTYIYLLSRSDL